MSRLSYILLAVVAAWVDAANRGFVSKNLHLNRAGFRLYVRQGMHSFGDLDCKTLDIASIGIPENHRGRGWFRSFRRIAEALNPWEVTLYECVHNERLADYFRSEGLASDGPISFHTLHHDKLRAKVP